MVTCILVGVSNGKIWREHCDTEQTVSKFAFCDYFQSLKYDTDMNKTQTAVTSICLHCITL